MEENALWKNLEYSYTCIVLRKEIWNDVCLQFYYQVKKVVCCSFGSSLLCFSYQPGHSVGMLAAVEHGPILCSDSNILCLSWKGRVPKSEKDKPVCRRRYYEEGWLATGNGRGVVGVTFTSSHCRRDRSTPQRINFNLRGHNSEVWSLLWNCFMTLSKLFLFNSSNTISVRILTTWTCFVFIHALNTLV